MSDEQQTKDRYLRASRTLVVFVHLAIITMSVTIVYLEVVNMINISKLELSKNWWAASIISVICQALALGCVTFSIVSIFLDFETLSTWFVIIPVTGITIVLIASFTMAIPTLGHNFPNNYADQLFSQYSNNDRFWNNLKGFEKSYKCCGIQGVGDYELTEGYSKAEGYCARRLKLIQFDSLGEGHVKSIRWDFDVAFNTSNYNKASLRQGLDEAFWLAKYPEEGRIGGQMARNINRECQATAFKFKERLEDWNKKLQTKLEEMMAQGMNNFTTTPSCGQVMGQLMADSRRLFMYTAGAWFLITLPCLGAFFFGRLKHAKITQQVVHQVIQQVQPQGLPPAQVYAQPVYMPPAPVYPYMTPRSSFNSLEGYDMFNTHQPSYYRHPSQNVSYYNPYANYPRDVSLLPQAPVIQPQTLAPLPPSPVQQAKISK